MTDPERLKRRTVLGAALGVLAAAPGARALAQGAPAGDPLAALGPWLDTLIPADETPGATALGVREAMLAQAHPQADAMALIEGGCRWLDGEAQKRGAANFAALGEAARDEIARAAASADARTGERLFFEASWRSATLHYYARPEVWPSLGYDGPPQPRGFPDADRKP